MQSYTTITHVIFDVDGLLLDTEDVYTEIMNTLAGRYGKEFTWELKMKQMGKTVDEAGKLFIEFLDIPLTVEEYVEQVNELCDTHMVQIKLMPGVERLVRHLHRHKIPMGVATGSSVSSLQQKTTNHRDLFSLFDPIVCSSSDPEVKRGKPAPDCFQVAASRFKDVPSPEKVLVFEDALNGVEAALAANMSVVWIPHQKDPSPAVNPDVRPTLLVNSMSEFRPQLFGLPAFSDEQN